MKKLQTRTHFLSGASLPNLIEILYKNRSELSWMHLPKIMLILVTPLLLFPFHLLEIIFYSGKIKRTPISKDPVFIIGHFRSGTTYLHNLLCQDRQFGFPTTYQCFVPGVFLTGKGFIKAIHKTTLPEKRPMDDVKLDSDFPQEEEFAMLALSPYSYYQCYYFPKKTTELFKSFAMVDQKNSSNWEKLFLFIVRKITYISNGKQLVMKNPVNTVRISRLVKMFPNAKFIYLHRDQDEVLRSTYKLFDRFLALYSFQEIEEEKLKDNIRWVYQQTIEQYHLQKHMIPCHNLIEISYKNFIHNPLHEVERIYSELQLDGYFPAKSNFEKYIAGQSTYVPDDASKK
jgi:omega-hydroxy-beta-dihydromenaquinone-9 sulfotransferase